VAHDEALGIGKNDYMPWHIPEDLQRFKEITTELKDDGYKPAVIMGMNTWYSIREKALPGRANVVLSRKTREIPEAEAYSDFQLAVGAICRSKKCGNVFVIGGGQIYKMALEHPALTGMYITEVRGDYRCDVHFPEYRGLKLKLVDSTHWQKSVGGEEFRYLKYTRI
jgi:dihydrofolate reductase